MFEFNPDGSIKLPGKVTAQKEAKQSKMKNQRCIKVKREVVNFSAPKKCCLHITLSDSINDSRFVTNIFNMFKNRASVPCSILPVDEKKFEVTIETDFRRCSDCQSLIGNYREFLDGNMIEEKGSCTYEGRKNSFTYEDYFD